MNTMAILIKGLEMPKDGQMLVIFPDGTAYVCFNGMRERLAWAEAVPVPPHGDLIDRDELELDTDWNDYLDGYSAYSERQIKAAPTIIEAEGVRK